jgi:Domain of unknown function (DUF5664)
MEGLGGTITIQTDPTTVTGNGRAILGDVSPTVQKATKIPVWQGVLQYFPKALMAIGDVSRFGAKKHNAGVMPTEWRRFPAPIYSDSLIRHLLAESQGEVTDPESGLLHAAHAAWNALARLEKALE